MRRHHAICEDCQTSHLPLFGSALRLFYGRIQGGYYVLCIDCRDRAHKRQQQLLAEIAAMAAVDP